MNGNVLHNISAAIGILQEGDSSQLCRLWSFNYIKNLMVWKQSFSVLVTASNSDSWTDWQHLGRKHCVFLFILALIPVANQSSQEWKEMIVHGLLVWLPNEMKHPAAISQGLLVCTFQKYFWHTWKRWAPTYNTEADACVVSNKNCSLWKLMCIHRSGKEMEKSQHQPHQTHRLSPLFVHKQLDFFQCTRGGSLVLK